MWFGRCVAAREIVVNFPTNFFDRESEPSRGRDQIAVEILVSGKIVSQTVPYRF